MASGCARAGGALVIAFESSYPFSVGHRQLSRRAEPFTLFNYHFSRIPSIYERTRDPRQVRPDERIRVPPGVALTTEAVQRAPREWVRRRYTDVRHWTEFPRGGHFLALEDPDLLARDLRTFFRAFRRG